MSLAKEVSQQLPYLRRYARALTGAQRPGDALVKATLEAIVADPAAYDRSLGPRVALYRMFHHIWSGVPTGPDFKGAAAGSDVSSIAQRLKALNPVRRQALLLTAMEDFSHSDAAAILQCAVDDIDQMVRDALLDLVAQTPASVLIIEDEPVISLDLANIVEEMGHKVAAIATTRTEAVAAAKASAPGLVLADIQLADDSSGIDAVNDILREMSAPVVFITAYPERLLTGERPEPAFLVTKPFIPESVKAVIAQALLLSEEALPA
jgi:DNA-directed RNA polymerase specialized sigma24 family protein/CheY-like chemotaxis protein